MSEDLGNKVELRNHEIFCIIYKSVNHYRQNICKEDEKKSGKKDKSDTCAIYNNLTKVWN